jgi:hypothetical protein
MIGETKKAIWWGVGEWGNGGGALELKFDSKFKNFYKNELISTQIINFLVNV